MMETIQRRRYAHGLEAYEYVESIYIETDQKDENLPKNGKMTEQEELDKYPGSRAP